MGRQKGWLHLDAVLSWVQVFGNNRGATIQLWEKRLLPCCSAGSGAYSTCFAPRRLDSTMVSCASRDHPRVRFSWTWQQT
jgi:hypothetical protein